MAKVKLKAPFTELSGKMGDFYFRKSKKEGEVILAKRPVQRKKGERTTAKVKLRLPFAEVIGDMSDYAFRKGKNAGEVILTKRPKKRKKPSKAQKAHWDRFTQAADYATAALADPELCAYYEAEAQRRDLQPRNVAMSDYLKGRNLLAKE